jgi:hypothetical protein
MSEHKPISAERPAGGASPPEFAFQPVPLRARHDGWTPDRQIAFIEKLADCGSVTAACKHVGLSR